MMSKTLKVRLGMASVAAVFAVVALAATRMDAFGGWKVVVWAGVFAVAYRATKLDTWLPFLGEAALPPGLLKPSQPEDATETLSVAVPPGTRYVAYWAASGDATDGQPPRAAYGSFDNAGVAIPAGGVARLRVACPATYRVQYAGLLPKHIHYRFAGSDGMMSRVHTRELAC